MAIDPYAIVITDADGRLTPDIGCMQCGYNLKTLPLDGVCPECGLAVGRSVQGDLLRFALPEWVDKLVLGTYWLLAAPALALLGGCVLYGFIIAFVVSQQSSSSSPPPAAQWTTSTPFFATVALFGIFTGAVTLYGWWLLTTPEPSRALAEKPRNPRVVLRWTVVTLFGVQLLDVAAHWLLPDWRFIVNVLSFPVAIAQLTAMGYFTAGLARRIPHPSMQQQCLIVMWLFLVGTVVAGAVQVVAAIFGLTVPATATPSGVNASVGSWVATVITFVAGGLPVIVAGIWALVLLIRFMLHFRAAAKAARDTWANQEPAMEAW